MVVMGMSPHHIRPSGLSLADTREEGVPAFTVCAVPVCLCVVLKYGVCCVIVFTPNTVSMLCVHKSVLSVYVCGVGRIE